MNTTTAGAIRDGLISITEARARMGSGWEVASLYGDQHPDDRQIISRIRARDAEGRKAAAKLGLYEIRSEVTEGGTSAELMIYGPIGGWFGVWPEDVAAELQSIGDVSKITVRLDSPGGSVFDGIAIYNLLRKHQAEVHVEVDSMAASIASVIAQAGDQITMNRGSEMMIHAAWAGLAGNAGELRDYADFLDRQTLKVARIYTAEAGQDDAHWLDLMNARPDGTWFLADEAVAQGLAHDHEDLIPEADAEQEEGAEPIDVAALLPFTKRPAATGRPPMKSTDATPEATPDSSAAEAAGRQAVARQRRHAVAQARTDLMRAKLNTGRN